MKNKSKIFDLSAISIIACDCLQAVICMFVDLFFISQILRWPDSTPSQNIINIGLFYVIYYLILTGSYAVTGYALKKINKSIFVSIGSVILTIMVISVYLLQDDLVTFVPLFAALYGLGFAFFSSGFHNLTGETISSKHQVKFFAVKRILFQLTYVIFPVALGFVVDFSTMILVLFAVCALLITFSFLIRPKKVYKLSFNLREFGKHLRENKKDVKPLFLVYLSNFFRGASFDCFTTLITILVISNVGGNSDLGMYQSIFTAFSLITMVFYLKYYRKKRAKAFIIPTLVLVTASIVGILSATNKITIIVFYGVYVVLNVILMSISDSRRAGVIRVLSLHSHILESNAFSEFALGAGRIIGSLSFIFAGIFDNLLGNGSQLFLKLSLAFICLMYIGYGISLIVLEKALIKQDEEFKKVHVAEEIIKTED